MLDSRERLRRAIRREDVDRPPVAAWRHFPDHDGDPQRLIDATMEFQGAYGCDLVKLMPSGMYSVIDYGVETAAEKHPQIGHEVMESTPIGSPRDWQYLPAVSATEGALAAELRVASEVRRRVGADIPVLDTLFSPLTMAAKIAGAEQHNALLDSPEADLVFSRLAEDILMYARASLSRGVDGFFYATQHATTSPPELAERYNMFGRPYDQRILEELRGASEFLMLHLHGPNPMTDLAQVFPVDIVNWEDREGGPALQDVLAADCAPAVCGGIDRTRALRAASPQEAEEDVQRLLTHLPPTGVVLAPGCVLYQDTRWENLAASLNAVRSVSAGGARSE